MLTFYWSPLSLAVTSFLSCVSGGGYTGAAFLDWKQKYQDNFEFKEFEDNMKQHSGYIVNWRWEPSVRALLGPPIDLLCLGLMLAMWFALTVCVVSSCAACIAHFVAFALKNLQPSPVGKLVLVLAPLGTYQTCV